MFTVFSLYLFCPNILFYSFSIVWRSLLLLVLTFISCALWFNITFQLSRNSVKRDCICEMCVYVCVRLYVKVIQTYGGLWCGQTKQLFLFGEQKCQTTQMRFPEKSNEKTPWIQMTFFLSDFTIQNITCHPAWQLVYLKSAVYHQWNWDSCCVLSSEERHFGDIKKPSLSCWLERRGAVSCELSRCVLCRCPLPQRVPLSHVMGTATPAAGAWCINPDRPPEELQAWRTLGKERSPTGASHKQGVDLCLCEMLWLKECWKHCIQFNVVKIWDLKSAERNFTRKAN